MGLDKRSSQFEFGLPEREIASCIYIGAGVAPLICHPLASHQIFSRICVAISPCNKYCTKHFPCSLAAPNICRRGRKGGKRGSCPSPLPPPPLRHILHCTDATAFSPTSPLHYTAHHHPNLIICQQWTILHRFQQLVFCTRPKCCSLDCLTTSLKSVAYF